MWTLLYLPLLYLAAVVDTALLDRAGWGGLTPSALALLAAAGVIVGGPRGIAAAALAGLCGDLLMPGRLGVGLAAWIVVGTALDLLRRRLPLDVLPVRAAAIGVVIVAWAVLVIIARGMLGEPLAPWSTALLRALGMAAATALVGVPVAWWLGRRGGDEGSMPGIKVL